MLNRRYPSGAKAPCRWLAPMIVMVLTSTGALAESVYKCTNADGAIAFQAQPCAVARQQSTVTLSQAPAYAPSPAYAVDARPARKPHKPRQSRSSSPRVVSYQCRSSDGQVFYRHHGCPHAVASRTNPRKSVAVSALKIPRSQACRQIHRAGAIGRNGHVHDEIVSAYDRNLGRDPCD